MTITKKKIVLMILIGIGLIADFIMVLFPDWFGFTEELSTFPTVLLVFYLTLTVLLFWNGIYAGHNFANRAGWDGTEPSFRLALFIIAWFIGYLLSVPISLYEIFFKNDY